MLPPFPPFALKHKPKLRETKQASALGFKEAHTGRGKHEDQEAEELGKVIATGLRDVLSERKVRGQSGEFACFRGEVTTAGHATARSDSNPRQEGQACKYIVRTSSVLPR